MIIVGVISTLVALCSLVWFLGGLFMALFPSRREVAVRIVGRAAVAFAASIAVAIAAGTRPGSEDVSTAQQGGSSTSTVAGVSEASAADGKLSPSKEFIWIRANQRLLAKKLRDPDSATFDKGRVSYKSGAPVVCGSVNAKNGFGGYSGAERYIGMGDTIGVFLESEVSDFGELWRKVC